MVNMMDLKIPRGWAKEMVISFQILRERDLDLKRVIMIVKKTDLETD